MTFPLFFLLLCATLCAVRDSFPQWMTTERIQRFTEWTTYIIFFSSNWRLKEKFLHTNNTTEERRRVWLHHIAAHQMDRRWEQVCTLIKIEREREKNEKTRKLWSIQIENFRKFSSSISRVEGRRVRRLRKSLWVKNLSMKVYNSLHSYFSHVYLIHRPTEWFCLFTLQTLRCGDERPTKWMKLLTSFFSTHLINPTKK